MSTIVVGLDGSEGSSGALRFALTEARLRGATLKAVSTWQIPATAYETGWVPSPTDLADFPRLAQDAIDKELAAMGEEAAGIEVTPVVREGHPADVLCAEAHDADLLVLGSRGLGGFRGLMLGSVSQQCAHHAPCPVAIVPTK